jgi:acyl carrier protein
MSFSTLEAVKDVIVGTLGIEDRSRIESATTPLLGNIPELDSFAVLSLAAALESHFGFQIDDSDFTGDVFETVGSLAQFVDRSLAERSRLH